MSVEIIGLKNLGSNLERALAKNRDGVKQAVSEIGDVGVYESALRAPVAEGHLTAAIAKELGCDEDGICAAVMVPNNSPAAPYAMRMHEDHYRLGEKSLDKQRRAGVEVGRKYITRGIEAGKAKFLSIIKDKLEV